MLVGSNGTRAKGVSSSLLLHKRAISMAAVLSPLCAGACERGLDFEPWNV